MDPAPPPLHPETVAVTAGRPPAAPDAPLNQPPVLAAVFQAGGDLEYGRGANPSWTAFEDALGALEGGRALAFASGMAAIAAVLDEVPDGGIVVAPRHAYSGTLSRLTTLETRGRIGVRLVDVSDAAGVAAAAQGAAMVWIESPTNPALEIADIDAITAGARAAGALSVVDNTFATPLLQRPLEQGADVVVHSVTKWLAGHSDLLMGAVVTRDEERLAALAATRLSGGAVPSAFEAFLALRGLRTLPVRFERAQSSAARIAAELTGHPALSEVRHPGVGGIVSVVLTDAARADAFVGAVRLWRHATSLGGVESTLERRRRWANEAPSIPEGLVRLSVGLEHPDDLLADLRQALAAVPVP